MLIQAVFFSAFFSEVGANVIVAYRMDFPCYLPVSLLKFILMFVLSQVVARYTK